MSSCASCGSWIPDDQGSQYCSMCYGDPFHGKDGYYQDAMEQAWREEEQKREQEQEHEGGGE